MRTAVAASTTGRAQPAAWSMGLALLLLALSLGMVAFSFASLVLPGSDALPDRPSPILFLIAASVMLTYPFVGTLLAVRRPRNPLGWLLLLLGIGFTLSFFSPEYLGRATISGWPLPGAAWVAWLSTWVFVPTMSIALGWIPLLFPTGHVLSPRWVPVAWALGIVTAAGATAAALDPVALDGVGAAFTNPIGVPALGGLIDVVNALLLPAVVSLGVLSVTSLLLRFRRSRGVERQQLRWFLLATATFLASLIATFATGIDDLFVIALLAAAGIPIATGIAILRYRLYDIDRLISRTIGWAVITVILGGVFVGGVVILQALLTPVTQENTLAVAGSTLVALALFGPLRHAVQRAVDRRFDRTRYDAQSTTDLFVDRVRNEVDLGRVRAELVATATDAVRPTAAGLWLRSARDRT
jgi:hypothetical protein